MTSTTCTKCAIDTNTPPSYRRSRIGTQLSFLKNGTCSKTLMTVLDSAFDHPMPKEECAANPLAGGLMQGYQCGMLWGATLAAGAAAYRLYGPGAASAAASMRAAKRIIPAFKAQNHHINCMEITETDPRKPLQVFLHFIIKGGTFVCMRRAADFAPKAMAEINAALYENENNRSCDPMSCAALLAEKMGVSDLHQTMAAGLAGGIGFSGGACGALGAAIWLTGLYGYEAGENQRVINKRTEILNEQFLKVTDYEYECAAVVGKRFDGIADHTEYLRSGGCLAVVDALVAVTRVQPTALHVKRSA
jgi:hypothetical protein